MKWRIGTCGFSKGRAAYYKQFGVVEVQKTFYEWRAEKTAPVWREHAPPAFEFILKASQAITHLTGSPTYRRYNEPIPATERQAYGFFRSTPQVRAARRRMEKMVEQLRSSILLYQLNEFIPPLEKPPM